MSPYRTRPAAVALGAAVLVAASVVVPRAAAADRNTTVLTWYDATAETIAAAGAPTQITNSRTWAIGWLAAARATRSVPTGVERGSYKEAALAAAVHRALVTLVPSRTEQLDATYGRTLDAVPDGPAERRGVAAGERQADLLLASRQGDGLDPGSVNAPCPVRPAAPGVWQPTPPAHAPAAQYGNRLADPFVLTSQDQFRLGPPPRAGLRALRRRPRGGTGVRRRRQHRTQRPPDRDGHLLARLLPHPVHRAAARGPLARRPGAVRTGAAGGALPRGLVDTQIATADSKYAYERWRPVTAIRTGALAPDPDWTPLHATPAHPDHPSGHNTYSGAAETVLSALVGPRTAPFDLTSPTAPGVTRTYTAWRQLSDENVDARVLSGIHTRSADEAGITLGKDVARYVLHHAGHLLAPARDAAGRGH